MGCVYSPSIAANRNVVCTDVSRWGMQTLSADRPGDNRNIAISKRLHRLFDLAGLPYKSPHKFRHGHTIFGLQHAKTMVDYQAVSTNLMHEDIRVTDSIYALLVSDEVKQRITGLTAAPVAPSTAGIWHAGICQHIFKRTTRGRLDGDCLVTAEIRKWPSNFLEGNFACLTVASCQRDSPGYALALHRSQRCAQSAAPYPACCGRAKIATGTHHRPNANT